MKSRSSVTLGFLLVGPGSVVGAQTAASFCYQQKAAGTRQICEDGCANYHTCPIAILCLFDKDLTNGARPGTAATRQVPCESRLNGLGTCPTCVGGTYTNGGFYVSVTVQSCRPGCARHLPFPR